MDSLNVYRRSKNVNLFKNVSSNNTINNNDNVMFVSENIIIIRDLFLYII